MIPARHVVGVRRWQVVGPRNAHGVEPWGYGPAVPVPVHAVAPRLAQEPSDPRRWVVVEGLTVYAPAGTHVGEDDRVLWPAVATPDGGVDVTGGEEYEVDGPMADWTNGPWPNPAAGVTFELTQVRG